MTDIAPFLRQFEETHDWRIWSIIADYFADDEDDVGERWALWIRDGKVNPNKAKRENCYMWCWSSLYKITDPTHASYYELVLALPSQERMPFPESTNPYYGIANAYLRLLHGWRRISDADREAIMQANTLDNTHRNMV